ncbi:MAG: hypothetical protein K6E84_04515 [Lachnospiraceae bacterium]|nr:hypothetical protein [Lachnospiraceae bacterium]
MTDEEKVFLDRITEYANKVMADIDPDPTITPISEQLNYLRPVMEEIAGETGESVEVVFIRYMDLASTVAAKKQKEFEDDFVDFADPTQKNFRF